MVFRELSTRFNLYSQYAFSNTTSLKILDSNILTTSSRGTTEETTRANPSQRKKTKKQVAKHLREDGGDCLPAEHLWVSVHDIQRLFEAAILNKANDFTVKGRHIIPVFVQNCGRREGRRELQTLLQNIHSKTNKPECKHCDSENNRHAFITSKLTTLATSCDIYLTIPSQPPFFGLSPYILIHLL